MSKHDSPSRELRDWIVATARAGHGIDAILGLMHKAGYGTRQSRQIVARILDQPGLALDIVATPPPGLRPRHPQPPVADVDGRRVGVSVCLDTPPLRVLEGVLDDAECDELIALARPRMDRALTVDSSGQRRIDSARTSSGMFFALGENALIRRIEQRLADLVAMPVDHGEALQILQYVPGQQYEPHCDWFDPSLPGARTLMAKGGQRVASIIMYLNAPIAGGGTHFPNAGITVTPRRGAAVYFAYEGGETISLHAGLPVIDGEKWIATKWLRERPYR